MKKIRYTAGKSLDFGRYVITQEGVDFNPDMEKHPAFRSLLSSGKLVIEDVSANAQVSEVVSDNSEDVSSTHVINGMIVSQTPICQEQPNISETPQVVISTSENTDSKVPTEESDDQVVVTSPTDNDLDEISVITQDPNNPILKTTMPLTQAIEKDIEALDEELKKISEKQEIIVPEKKN